MMGLPGVPLVRWLPVYTVSRAALAAMAGAAAAAHTAVVAVAATLVAHPAKVALLSSRQMP